MPGYLSQPCLSADHLAFVCEDALWVAERDGSAARRLTAEGPRVQLPVFSPDGRTLAFAWNAEGEVQVWTVPVEGGAPRRITAESSPVFPVTFRPSGALVVRSLRGTPLKSWTRLFEVDPGGGPLRPLPVGYARQADFDRDDDTLLLGRRWQELAIWKRYRGGTRGEAWIGSLGRGEFRRLLELESGVATPVFCAGRVFFVTDRDGVGNVWSCDRDGADLVQHTRGSEYYARGLRAHGDELVYARGAELIHFDARSESERRLEVRAPRSGFQLARRFAQAPDDLAELELAPDGAQIAATVRGKLLLAECWGPGPRRLGRAQGVRYRLPRFLAIPEQAGEPRRARTLAVVSDEGERERVEVREVESGERTAVIELENSAGVFDHRPAPVGKVLAVADRSGRLYLCDADASTPAREVGCGRRGAPRDLAWSADGRWLAWIELLDWTHPGGILHLLEASSGRSLTLNEAELPVHSPAFDPAGRFLYVLSERTFNPRLDAVQFGASTQAATGLFAFVLSARGLSPLDPRFAERVASEERRREKELDQLEGEEAERAKRAPRATEIDLAGLEGRIVELTDAPPGRYRELWATPAGVSFLEEPELGMLDDPEEDEDGQERLNKLVHLEVATGKRTEVMEGVRSHQVCGAWTLVRQKEAAHVLKTGEEPPEDPPRKGKNRGSGEIDLERLRVEIEPEAEWRQMFAEAWRLQRLRFWTEDMAGVDWQRVRARYEPLLERVATRAELSDLIWEMQGELGTSHAYEYGGDYPETPRYPYGALGADWSWDGQGWCIERILSGDPWRGDCSSPLRAPGVGVEVGERIVSVDGVRLDERHEPQAALADRAGRWVELGILPAGGGAERRVAVRCLAREDLLRYRDWVRSNRATVRARSGDRLGYLHVPDMSARGLSEFHRAFRAESGFDGLVVDVRHNGGGFVSELLLAALRHRVIAWERARHGAHGTYPQEALRGPIVAICDAFCGSDGDMFCQAFRDLGLGTLVGERTWGGVVGIDADTLLADGTVVTQPEYATCFVSVGWEVENHGVEPDERVDLDPASAAAGRDPQLERAIEIALDQLARQPAATPAWPPVPSRRLPV